MNNKNLLNFLSLTIVISLCGCEKNFDRKNILNQCKRNSPLIDSIMREGINFCEEDIKKANINLREIDSWSPSDFVKEPRLEELTGVHVRYVSFYSIKKNFVGMVMRINPNLILYKGDITNSQIIVSGVIYNINESNNSFAFYSQ